ncbi:MAG: RNA methyltransferase [Clostridiales bacterium]
MLKKINSKNNQIIKRYSLLKTKKKRDILKRFIIEGHKFVNEAIKEKVSIRSILVSDSFYYSNKIFIDKLSLEYDIYIFDNSLLKRISDTENSQGILAEIDFNKSDNKIVNDHILILDEISDPGNMGTIIRSADAFGFNFIYLIQGCVDIYNSKVLRSTMGSVFRVSTILINDREDFIKELKNKEYKIFSTSLEGREFNFFRDSFQKKAFVIGNEASGISEIFKKESDFLIKIPICKKVESLNAAVAASIIMYEYNKIEIFSS